MQTVVHGKFLMQKLLSYPHGYILRSPPTPPDPPLPRQRMLEAADSVERSVFSSLSRNALC